MPGAEIVAATLLIWFSFFLVCLFNFVTDINKEGGQKEIVKVQSAVKQTELHKCFSRIALSITFDSLIRQKRCI